MVTHVHAFTKSQKAMYKLIKQEAPKYTPYSSWMADICLTESSLGYYSLGDGGKSLGPMQVQVATARDIAKRSLSMKWVLRISKKRLATLLLTKPKVAIEIACKIFEFHRKRHGLFGATSRYNGGSNNVTYYRRVVKNHELLKDMF